MCSSISKNLVLRGVNPLFMDSNVNVKEFCILLCVAIQFDH
jgi:hypothetical protein